MKLQIYAIHDQAIKEFTAPDVARTPGEAERKFKTNVNNPQNGFLYTNPEHYGLYQIGTYDTETGKIEGLKEPHHVISAIQCKDAPATGNGPALAAAR